MSQQEIETKLETNDEAEPLLAIRSSAAIISSLQSNHFFIYIYSRLRLANIVQNQLAPISLAPFLLVYLVFVQVFDVNTLLLLFLFGELKLFPFDFFPLIGLLFFCFLH